jgi:hypothetical protein
MIQRLTFLADDVQAASAFLDFQRNFFAAATLETV